MRKIWIVLLALTAINCGSGFNQPCKSDSECSGGLKCVAKRSGVGVVGSKDCLTQDTACSLPCTTEAECSSIPDSTCYSCDGRGACGRK